MQIGIDGNEANIKERVGVNVYAFEVLWGLFRLLKKNNKHNVIVFLKNSPVFDMPPETNFWKYKVFPGRGLWIITKLTPFLVFGRKIPDVFFSPSHYLPLYSRIPLVCSIMDLGYLEFTGQFRKKDFWQLKLWTAYSVFISKYIIAISNSTKKDIVRHYKFASKKVYVTHLSYDKQKFNTQISSDDVRRIKNKYSIVNDYILFLSTLKPSKNVEGLLDAFYLLKRKSKHRELKLVIAGKKGWFFESIFNKVEELRLTADVIFTDYVPEKDKPALIAGAKIFALPSYWEGFGLDVLSAMASGVPVVITRVGSLPEVAGGAGVYVENNPRSIANGLKKVLLASENEYNKLVSKGIMQAEKFSWDKTAEKTIEIIEKTV